MALNLSSYDRALLNGEHGPAARMAMAIMVLHAPEEKQRHDPVDDHQEHQPELGVARHLEQAAHEVEEGVDHLC